VISETKIRNLMRALPIAIAVLLFNNCLFSQVVVERSKDKVIISGVPYYIHQVKKGETSYSISKAYGITVEELTKENPPAVYGINTGQTLRIPVKPVSQVPLAEQANGKSIHDDSKFVYHILKPGETIYFLSRTYDVSENEIIKSNPGIDITKLSVGAEIAIPRKVFMTTRQKFDEPEIQAGQEQETGYIYHKVLNGESLSSIAETYGMTVRELRKINRDLRFPQVGDYVRVPGVKTPEKVETVSVPQDTAAPVIVAPLIRRERTTLITPVTELKGTLNVAVLLPFYLKENASRTEIDSSKSVKGKKLTKIVRGDDWIYPWSLDFLEMYEGILLAADTLRALGLNINMYAFDIKSDSIELTRVIRSGKLEGMDLIIGPVYSNNLSIVAAYAKSLGIPVVSPVPLYDNSVLGSNPELFLANSSLEIAQRALAKKISEYQDNNFVFIHADTTGVDPAVKRFKNLIISELSAKVPYEEIKFKEFLFYNRSMFDNDSINRLSHALSDQSKNIVIIASEYAPVISETMIDVHSLSRRFDVRVFGYPVLRDLDNLDPKYFFDLDLMIYSPSWIDYSKMDVKKFNNSFRLKFLTEPTEKSYAWQGYDLAYFFLSGLSLHGKEFIQHPEMHHPDLLQTDYDFVRKSSGDGFENLNLFLVRYTKDYEVRLVEENGGFQQR
jgi:LysM repeat protein